MARTVPPRRHAHGNPQRGHGDRKRSHGGGKRGAGGGGPPKNLWLYGRHPVLSALANPRRQITRLLATSVFLERYGDGLKGHLPPQAVDREMLDSLLGPEAVHQGIAAYAKPLPPVAVDDVLQHTAGQTSAMLLVLDEITDPRNVGAIMRSAAAFGAAGMIVTRHNAATETGALAKAASGALDLVPVAEAPNLRRTLEQLKEAGFWCLGLDHPAPEAMGTAPPPARTAWVLGAEGRGLRQLTARHCDSLVEVAIAPQMESLNVSNAAAIALYEWARHHR